MNPDAVATPTTSTPAARPGWWQNLKDTWRLLYRAGIAWDRDNAMRLSAAVAMYTILSLSPLLVITIKVMALILSDESAARQVRRQVEAALGPLGGQAVEGMITDTVRRGSGVLPTVLSIGMLLLTASGVFNELRDSLNVVWGVEPKSGRGIWAVLRDRLLSVGMVFVIGFLLLVSQVISVTLTLLSEYIIGTPGWAAVAVDFVVSTGVIAALFAMLFRVLPEVRLGWQDVLFGAVVTAVLFKIGQYLQALYFTYGTTASAYGAAGSFVVVLLWVYYSCWILFYGAELIKERAHMLGREIEPAADAVRVSHPAEVAWQCKK
ncbi:MAG: YihY/virulence factor BrkB family protein [Gemmataceae bacterium]|nr:YihY/virulence factor BrkB family protein [Gemmataceae bacterium]